MYAVLRYGPQGQELEKAHFIASQIENCIKSRVPHQKLPEFFGEDQDQGRPQHCADSAQQAEENNPSQFHQGGPFLSWSIKDLPLVDGGMAMELLTGSLFLKLRQAVWDSRQLLSQGGFLLFKARYFLWTTSS
jgi:hypothetical protein